MGKRAMAAVMPYPFKMKWSTIQTSTKIITAASLMIALWNSIQPKRTI